VALRGKHDPFSVGRKRCVVVEAGGGKQRMLAGAIGVGDVERHLGGPQTVHELALLWRGGHLERCRESKADSKGHEFHFHIRFHFGLQIWRQPAPDGISALYSTPWPSGGSESCSIRRRLCCTLCLLELAFDGGNRNAKSAY